MSVIVQLVTVESPEIPPPLCAEFLLIMQFVIIAPLPWIPPPLSKPDEFPLTLQFVIVAPWP